MTAFTRPVAVLRVTSMFGESRGDHIHNGIDLAGDGETVRAVLSGSVVFYRDEENEPWDQPYGYGNYVILQHGDRYRSQYYHLQKGSIPRDMVAVSEGFPIGRTGNTGHSGGPHLHFTLIDTMEKKLLNPMAFLTGFVDSGRPSIGGLYYSYQPRQGFGLAGLNEVSRNTVLTQGREVWFFVQACDTIQTTRLKAGIYRLESAIDGKKARSLKFDSFDLVPPAGSFLDSRLKFEDIFGGPYLYRIGNVKVPADGILTVESSVWDYHQNTQNAKYDIKTTSR
jgi:murein DD-endopeptidase MepM/ murein hydrolase activator NlpD